MERGLGRDGRLEGVVCLRFVILVIDADSSLCGVTVLSRLQHASLCWTGSASARVTSEDTIYQEHSQTLHTALPALFAARLPQSQAYLVAILREDGD